MNEHQKLFLLHREHLVPFGRGLTPLVQIMNSLSVLFVFCKRESPISGRSPRWNPCVSIDSGFRDINRGSPSGPKTDDLHPSALGQGWRVWGDHQKAVGAGEIGHQRTVLDRDGPDHARALGGPFG